jgi:N,N'-diacetylchitobiose transport system permease protein
MTAVDSPTTARPARAGGTRPGRPAKRRLRRQGENRTAWLLSLPALILLVGLLGWPMLKMILLSFQDLSLRQLFTGENPPFVGFDQYQKVLTDPVFWTVVWHTALFTVVSVTSTVLIGLGVALVMRRVHPWVRIAMVVAMMFVWSMPQLVAAQSFRWMTDADFGVVNYLIDKLPGVSFENHAWFVSTQQGWIVITTLVVWAGIPFLAITLNAGLTQVPKELLEAATMDGASGWQALRSITLPILKPLLTIVTTLSVIWNFGLFTQVWVLRDSKPEQSFQTLATYSYSQAFGQAKYSPGSAISVITVLLLLGVMVLYIRQMFKIGEVD